MLERLTNVCARMLKRASLLSTVNGFQTMNQFLEHQRCCSYMGLCWSITRFTLLPSSPMPTYTEHQAYHNDMHAGRKLLIKKTLPLFRSLCLSATGWTHSRNYNFLMPMILSIWFWVRKLMQSSMIWMFVGNFFLFFFSPCASSAYLMAVNTFTMLIGGIKY